MPNGKSGLRETTVEANFQSVVRRYCWVLVSCLVLAAGENSPLKFKKIQLHDQFWSEGATFGDLNNDGINDIVAGPWWWEGPDFKKRHEYYAATATFDLKLGPMTSVKVPGFEGTLGKN